MVYLFGLVGNEACFAKPCQILDFKLAWCQLDEQNKKGIAKMNLGG